MLLAYGPSSCCFVQNILYAINYCIKEYNNQNLLRLIIVCLVMVIWYALKMGNAPAGPFRMIHSLEGVSFVGLGWVYLSWFKALAKRNAVIVPIGSIVVFTILTFCLIAPKHLPTSSPILVGIGLLRILAAIGGSLMRIAAAVLLPGWR